MTTAASHDFTSELLERRRHVVQARKAVPAEELNLLLEDIDAALERISSGTYEICTVCRDNIETERLAHDPLTRCCSDHLTAEETARVRRDLALARRVQLGLLPPESYAIDGWRFSSRYETAGEVGGDFYDVIPNHAPGETLVIVGDVSGKGIAASMLMASLVATFRSLSSLSLPAGELMARVNAIFHHSTPSASYATMAALSLRPGGQVDLYSAGHWPPILRTARDTGLVAVESGLPLGLFPNTKYSATHLELHPQTRCSCTRTGRLTPKTPPARTTDGNGFAERWLRPTPNASMP